jgi:dTDP-4-dehydrorhamnose reductase
VFDGSGTKPWQETDATAPLNAYGRSKREGEERIEAVGGKYLIFRTSWVYDETGKNFLNTMLRLGAERDELKVVNDQFGAPTYARHLAVATLQALENANNSAAFPSGIYHLCGGGQTSWAGFAEQIFHLSHLDKEVKVYGIPASSYPTPAKRPYNSRLDCSKAQQILGVALPDWREGLRECLSRKQIG